MAIINNTTINNIKKSFNVDFNKQFIEERMPYMCASNQYYKSFDKTNAILGLWKYNFKSPISGLVDWGMQAHITLTEIDNNKTKIDIEIIDNWQGTQGFDIDNSHKIMDIVCISLVNLLNTEIADIQQQYTINTNTNNINTENDDTSILWGIGGIIFIGIVIYTWFFI